MIWSSSDQPNRRSCTHRCFTETRSRKPNRTIVCRSEPCWATGRNRPVPRPALPGPFPFRRPIPRPGTAYLKMMMVNKTQWKLNLTLWMSRFSSFEQNWFLKNYICFSAWFLGEFSIYSVQFVLFRRGETSARNQKIEAGADGSSREGPDAYFAAEHECKYKSLNVCKNRLTDIMQIGVTLVR